MGKTWSGDGERNALLAGPTPPSRVTLVWWARRSYPRGKGSATTWVMVTGYRSDDRGLHERNPHNHHPGDGRVLHYHHRHLHGRLQRADAAVRAELVAKTFTPDGGLIDPPIDGKGHAGITEMMGAVSGTIRSSLPPHDGHRRPPQRGALRVGAGRHGRRRRPQGTDVAEFDADGAISRVLGFLGDLSPATEPDPAAPTLARNRTGGAADRRSANPGRPDVRSRAGRRADGRRASTTPNG